MLLPSCISSNPLLMSASALVAVFSGPSPSWPPLYHPTFFGPSVRRAAEGRALPDAAGDQLKWAGCDLRAGRRDADDDGLAPAAMAGFERLAHHRDVAGAVEGIVGATDLIGAALRHVDEVRDQIAAD